MNKWDVVLLTYPFTDLTATKVRPAVVISPDSENCSCQDAVFLLVTSNTDRRSEFDVILDSNHDEFARSGLKCSSAIRANKIVTLKQTLVKRTLGKLGPKFSGQVESQLARFYELPTA